jgi:hypothetical protein
MSLHLVTPSDPAQERPADDHLPPPGKGWHGHLADTCYILIKAGGAASPRYRLPGG